MFALFMLASCGETKSTSSNPSGEKTSETSEAKYEGPVANGVYNYLDESVEERSKILGQLEGYAMKHHLAGIPLYDDAGYELFSPRVKLASETYVPNYGFGVGESSIDPAGNMFNNAPIDSSKVSYPTYFQAYATEDSGTYNYWNSTGSDVASKNAMISSAYFTTRMTEDKKGYEWEGELARTDAPIALNEDGSVNTNWKEGETSRFWRVPVYVGTDSTSTGRKFCYHTSPDSKYASKYDGLEIKLEDYLTPFKAMLDNALSRASGLIDDAAGFYGASDYLYASDKDKDWGGETRTEPQKNYFDGVGIKLNTKENSVDFKFITPITQFYAMYNTASSLYSPIPESFIEEVGIKKFGAIGDSSDPKKNCDNLISCGAYIVTAWEQNKETVYVKNDDYNRADRVKFPGYVETGYKDEEAAFQGFLNGVLDEVTVPSKHVSEYASNPLARKTEGSTVIKININSCTQEQWEGYFGKNGTAYPHATEKTYWDVKPIMSNDDFLNGLYFAIDRATLAEKTGHNPAYGYLSSAYKIDPENDLAYRYTSAGKAVTSEYESVVTNGVKGYSPAMAQQLFTKAIKTLVADGTYDEDETITLKFWWRKDEALNNIGNTLKTCMETPFNAAAAALGYSMKLVINNEVAGSSYTDAYSKMDQGEFDFAEGAITGNVLNPLSFMSVICTDSLSQGFTCNWGDNTAEVSATDPVMYDGVAWSYDALQVAANGAAVVERGVNVEPVKSTNQPTEDACFAQGKSSFIGFETPDILTADGDSGIDYTIKYIWLQFANGGNNPGYYYNLGTDSFESIEKTIDNYYLFEIKTATIQSCAQNIANSAKMEIDTAILVVGFNCYFSESGVEKSVQATVSVKLTQIGCEEVAPK